MGDHLDSEATEAAENLNMLQKGALQPEKDKNIRIFQTGITQYNKDIIKLQQIMERVSAC
jgi:hypothetical protein